MNQVMKVKAATSWSPARYMFVFFWVVSSASVWTLSSADDSLQRKSSWQVHDADSMTNLLRSGLEQLGVVHDEIDLISEKFQTAITVHQADTLDSYLQAVSGIHETVDRLVVEAETSVTKAGKAIDPNAPGYAAIESLPKSMRASIRTWLARELVRQRLYDEALPVVAEIEPTDCIDPATTLFFRGSCYHALLMKKEALSDLRRLLENEEDCPIRFSRTAKMMVADIKPMKEDSLDEISRIMTDVTRRLDLGRADEEVKDREQKIIDKLTKLIDKIEKQQQQQQQQQSGGGGSANPKNQSSSPGEESQAGGANGAGDVDRKDLDERDTWGDLPPAERQQALQHISRDLPSHYREAIEAYLRKIATD